MNRSDTEPIPDPAEAADDAPDEVLRYRAGSESVQVTQHDTPGFDVYGPETAEVTTVDTPASREEPDPLDQAVGAVTTRGNRARSRNGTSTSATANER